MEQLGSDRDVLIILVALCLICGGYIILLIGQMGREILARAGQRVQIIYILENWTHDLLTLENLNSLSDGDLDQLVFMLSRAESEEAFEEAIRYHIH